MNHQPFDTKRKPEQCHTASKPLVWGAILAAEILGKGAHITYKDGTKELQPPYLLLCSHASVIDFPIAAKACLPHYPNWVISIEEFIGKEAMLRNLGGIYKRKFTVEVTTVKQMLGVLTKEKNICAMYPEARYSIAGINERMSEGIGKLVKLARVPVVLLMEHGSYFWQPQWNKSIFPLHPVTAEMSMIVNGDEIADMTEQEIQKRIDDAMVYDDYQWHYDHKIRIRSKKRAELLHRVLYQCPVCGKEFSMTSKGTSLHCEACNADWTMDEYGKLHRTDGPDVFTHVPDWYRWERENVRREVQDGTYRFEDTVILDRMVNAEAGFEFLGNVPMVQDESGITVGGKLENGDDFRLHRGARSMESIHIEYDFNKTGTTRRGPYMDLADNGETYFVSPLNKGDHLTKIHFATEALYDKANEAAKEA